MIAFDLERRDVLLGGLDGRPGPPFRRLLWRRHVENDFNFPISECSLSDQIDGMVARQTNVRDKQPCVSKPSANFLTNAFNLRSVGDRGISLFRAFD